MSAKANILLFLVICFVVSPIIYNSIHAPDVAPIILTYIITPIVSGVCLLVVNAYALFSELFEELP